MARRGWQRAAIAGWQDHCRHACECVEFRLERAATVDRGLEGCGGHGTGDLLLGATVIDLRFGLRQPAAQALLGRCCRIACGFHRGDLALQRLDLIGKAAVRRAGGRCRRLVAECFHFLAKAGDLG